MPRTYEGPGVALQGLEKKVCGLATNSLGKSKAAETQDESALVNSLDRARNRLDRSVYLLGQALDLSELLWCGCDLDDMVAEVDSFKRDCRVWRAMT